MVKCFQGDRGSVLAQESESLGEGGRIDFSEGSNEDFQATWSTVEEVVLRHSTLLPLCRGPRR